MDKYEYTVKAEKIKQLVGRRDYATAAKIADGIDWPRVQDVRMLMLVAEAFEKNGQYEEAKDVLLTAYDLVPIGKGMLYKLTEICLKQNKIGEAENYYDAYSKAAPNDTGRYELRYDIACARNESIERRIDILEQFERVDMDEKLFYELACLYHKAGRGRECVEMCDRIILWFGEGEYVDAAIELKNRYSGAVAEVRRKQEEATENRRRRIEEMEAQIGEWDRPAEEAPEEAADAELPVIDIPEEYFDEPDEMLYGGEPYAEPAGDAEYPGEDVYDEDAPAEPVGREPFDEELYRDGRPDIWEDPAIAGMTVGELLGDDGGDAPEEEYYDEPLDEDYDEFTDEYDDEYAEEDLSEFPEDGEEYYDDGSDGGAVPAGEIDLSEFVQAGSVREAGPGVEMLPWVNYEDPEANDVGRRIWASLEKAEKDRAFQPDPDMTQEPGYEDFRLEAPADEAEEAESTEAFSRNLEAALTEEVAAFDDVPAEPAEAEAPAAEPAEVREESAAEPEEPAEPAAAAAVPAAAAVTEEPAAEPMVFALPEQEIGGAVLPAVRGVLEPAWKARLFSRRFFDEQGFALPEDQLPADLDDTKRLELPWTYEEQTKKLDELKDIRFGGDAFARMNLTPEQDLVDPDRFQGDGTDYVDLSAVREETEAKRAEDILAADQAAGTPEPEFELLCILTEVNEGEDAIPKAMEMIHDAHASMGTEDVQTAKVTGKKLNSRGMKACLERLNGRDLIVLEAGDLDDELLRELVEEAENPGENAIVILADTPAELRALVARSPELARVGIYEEESGQSALPFAEAILSMPSEEPGPEAPAEEGFAPEIGAEEPAVDPKDAAWYPGEEAAPAYAEDGPVSISQILPDLHEELTGAAEEPAEPEVPYEEPEIPAAELTYDFPVEDYAAEPAAEEPAAEYEPAEELPPAEPSVEQILDDTYEAILGRDFAAPEKDLTLDEQMALAFGGAAEPEEELGDTAKLGGALAAELARMLGEPEAVTDEVPEPVREPEALPEPELPAGGTKEIEKLSAADLRPVSEREEIPEEDLPDELSYEEDAYGEDGYDEYEDYDDLGYDEEGEDGSFGAIRSFTRYVEEYAASLDCILDDTAGLAVYACAEELLDDGKPLSVDTARDLVDNAMEQAERTSLRSVFAKKYDKQGRLILREQHFHVE